nr:[protein-PII] uridylyltransferase [Alphaproteobacteria bacterium]
MDTTVSHELPFFDPQELRVELTALFNAHSNGDDARPHVLSRLKGLVDNAHRLSRERLDRDHNGRRCAHGLAQFEDALVSLIYDYTVTHIYRATNPSDAESMAIVATGGYGRDLLAPNSDIDLLFLLPYKQTPWGESVTEYILYLLWDLGFKVGHATRTVEQCIKLAQSDTTICTALLDTWLIHGDQPLFDTLQARFRAEVVQGGARLFVDAKMRERDDRHNRTGESRYLVEPNVKDGKGGLRDLHTLHWISKFLYGRSVGEEAVEAGIFTRAEMTTFRRCEDFLWTVRCFLHFLTGQAEERLAFEYQPILAEKLGYKDRGGLKSVERFMKHYFLVAKDVGDLTTILCSSLEMQQLKSSPGMNKMLNPSNWRVRRQIREKTDFRIDNDRLNVAHDDVFKNDPVNLIRFFSHAETTHTYLHPNAIRLLRRSLHLIDDELRSNPEANRIFLDLLTSKDHPAAILRRMNEAGVLGRFVPEFGRIVAMMQFNMYHHFTIDEHLLRTVAMLTDVEDGGLEDEVPLSTEIIPTIKNRRVLFVAAFLHDIGKGRDEDHSIVGARIAKELCPRFGMTALETELVVWLVAQHLTMSLTSERRDIADPKTITDFAAVVETPERLKLLLLLSVADIRAVGPGVWTGWKGQLLRSLYHETHAFLEKGEQTADPVTIARAAKEQLRTALTEWRSDEIEAFIGLHYPDYWLRTEAERQVGHARLHRRATQEGLKFAVDSTTDAFTAITDLTIFAPNHPRLLSLFAGACAANGVNIAGAHIATTRDGFAIDTFHLEREFDDDEDELRRARRIGETIDEILKGERHLGDILKKRRKSNRMIEAFTVEPKVVLDNDISEQFTVIEVEGRDRPGLLYHLTSAISDLSLDIVSAHINTHGEKVFD